MRGEGEILLVSTYELGHAPHGIALPAAFLRRAGFRKVRNLAGGLRAWAERVDPTMPRY